MPRPRAIQNADGTASFVCECCRSKLASREDWHGGEDCIQALQERIVALEDKLYELVLEVRRE
jgi:hypothetical protein